MSNQTQPRIDKEAWHKLEQAINRTGIDDRNEAIKAVGDGYLNARDEMDDYYAVYRKETRFLASCLAISAATSFVLLAFLGDALGWW